VRVTRVTDRLRGGYVAECTLAGVDIEAGNLDDILQDPDALAALAFDSDVYTTEIYLGGPARTKTCARASELLAEYVEGEFLPRFRRSLTAALGVDDEAEVEAKVQRASIPRDSGATGGRSSW
jgi:hypothetical protein